MRTPARKLSLLIACTVTAATCAAQSRHPDPLALLQKTAQTYAQPPKSLHLESIEIQTNRNRFEHSEFTTKQSILSAPDNAYRVTTMSGMGSTLSVSDGKTVHVLQLESNVYIEHPTGQSKTPDFFNNSVAWNQVISTLHTLATQFRSAHYLGEETLTLGSQHFRCYIVRAGKEDAKSGATVHPEFHYTYTFWIDKHSFVFRKIVDAENSAFMNSPDVNIPFDGRTETTYPVVDFAPQIDPASFTFAPPPGARLVASLIPVIGVNGSQQKTILIGKPAPDVTLTSATRHTPLSSFRGKPILIDFWASWCGPCVAAMPAMAALQRDFTTHGGVFLSIDQDQKPEDASNFLKQHHYDWQDFNDADRKLGASFHTEAIPNVLLIDSTGKVVYDNIGMDEQSLREAIAKLGPDFQALASKPCKYVTPDAANSDKVETLK